MQFAQPTTLAWRIANPCHDVAYTLPVAFDLRQAIIEQHAALGRGQLPERFYHSPPGVNHEHAHYLPLDVNQDGLIDHLWIHADCGIAPDLMKTLSAISDVKIGSDKIILDLIHIGGPDLLLGGPDKNWVSLTPFIAPKFITRDRQPPDKTSSKLRPEYTIENQISDMLEVRALPGAQFELSEFIHVGNTIKTIEQFEKVGFHRATEKRRGYRPASFVRIAFEEAISGPLSLGHNSHFGLGLFVTETGLQSLFHE